MTVTVVLGSNRERGFHQQGGPKEVSEGHQLRELMGMVVETRDWGYQRRWCPWGIDYLGAESRKVIIKVAQRVRAQRAQGKHPPMPMSWGGRWRAGHPF